MGDAEIKSVAQEGALLLERINAPKLCQSPREMSGSLSPLRPQR